MKVFFEIFDLDHKESEVMKFFESIMSDNNLHPDDKCSLEIESFYGKKYVTIRVYERVIN